MPMLQTAPDGGMLYAETRMGQTCPEPFNTITSCFFLIIAIYWTLVLWGKWRQHTFLSIAVVLLYIGGIGGTLYHGLRRWGFFIMMDWLPIMLLCVAAGVYFTARLTRWYVALAIVAGYAAFQFGARRFFQQQGDIQLFININYAVLAGLVLLPVLAFLIKTRFRNGIWVGIALLAFIFALTFRVADRWGWLENGTHFLWHTFGAVAAFCMFQYIYVANTPLKVNK